MPARNAVPGPDPATAAKVTVRTPNVPGYTNRVDAAKYQAMKGILLEVLPRGAPGLTQAQMVQLVAARKDATTFPGSTHTWWGKCVQLDLEAQGRIVREPTRPLRWHQA